MNATAAAELERFIERGRAAQAAVDRAIAAASAPPTPAGAILDYSTTGRYCEHCGPNVAHCGVCGR